jgi:FlaA1/EpsC-like NDP-sugar epimerase
VLKALRESQGGETFISKIPSFHIGDLAKAMLPDAILKEIGIREGEKLDEVMVTKDDSRTTYEFDKHYIIFPHFEWWDSGRNSTSGGKLVEEGFEYNSANNKLWLTIEQIREELKKLNLQI